MRFSKTTGAMAEGTALGRRIIRTKMSALYRLLNSTDTKLSCSVLHLLAAVNSTDQGCAAEMVDTFAFDTKAIRRAIKSGKDGSKQTSDKRGGGGKKGLRDSSFTTALLQFALSSLDHGNSSTKEKLLQVKDFLEPLLAIGVSVREDTVQHILRSIHEHVVKDKVIGRNTRIRFFNAKVLSSVSRGQLHKPPALDPAKALHLTDRKTVPEFFLGRHLGLGAPLLARFVSIEGSGDQFSRSRVVPSGREAHDTQCDSRSVYSSTSGGRG